ncbi:MAG TPA: S8 family serine peptidase [Vicinamibacterales bacterium]|nr:S8 family serine peptidase [Vicinamibacterales bacterium]
MAFRIASATLVLALVSTFAFAQQRLIVGVTDVGRAERELPAQAQVHLKIGISRAFAVTGDPERLRRLPFVRYVEPDPVDAVHIAQATELEYGVNNIDAEVWWGDSQGATTVVPGKGGAGARVAVLDTGINCGHPDFSDLNGNNGCVFGANYISDVAPDDDHGHGTHVASIIASRPNGVGVIGVAPEATVYAVKVLSAQGSGPWSGVAAGIDWAVANGMHVINMSLSASSGSIAVADAVAAAQAAGVLVVSAAGNSGCCNTVGYPAKYDGAMAIGAVDVNDAIAGFSSTGLEVDVVAPGVLVKAAVPTGDCTLCDPSGYKLLNGTSMAAPHAAGVGALLMSPFQGRTAAQAWYAMTSTAQDLGDAGFDSTYGNGRVNALAANNLPATDPPPPPPPSEDIEPPYVEITSPAHSSYVRQNTIVTIRAGATDNVGVTRVEFYVDLVGKCIDTEAPFTCNWVVPKGKGLYYFIEAYAFDAAGNMGSTYTIVVSR